MESVYVMKLLSDTEEYIRLEGDFSALKDPCMKSEIQYLDKEKAVFQVSEEGGLELPDFMVQEGIVFVSAACKEWMEEEGMDYVFFKQAEVYSDTFGIHETYWIMVPPRIDCLDIDKSVLHLEWDFYDGLLPLLEAEKIAVFPEMAGRFQMFKILGLLDNNIYVREAFYQKAQFQGWDGVCFMKLP